MKVYTVRSTEHWEDGTTYTRYVNEPSGTMTESKIEHAKVWTDREDAEDYVESLYMDPVYESGRYIEGRYEFEVVETERLNAKEIRELTGLSQSMFAYFYHIPDATLKKWEQGVRQAPPYVLMLLERVVREDLKNK